MLLRQTHHFVEGLPAIVLAVCIAFVVPNMAVCGNKYSNGVCTYVLCQPSYHAVSRARLPRCVPRARGGIASASQLVLGRESGLRDLVNSSASALQLKVLELQNTCSNSKSTMDLVAARDAPSA